MLGKVPGMSCLKNEGGYGLRHVRGGDGGRGRREVLEIKW